MRKAASRLLLLFTVLAGFAFTGCLPNADKWQQTIHAGQSNVLSSIPPARAFASAFPNCQISIASFIQNRPRFRHVQLTGDLFDRYPIYLRLEVEFTCRSRLEVLSYNVKDFYLAEVTAISTLEDGRTVYDFGESFRFHESQWQTLTTNAFRFDLIGITLKTNKPVEHFCEKRNAQRALQ